jgi:hypothetical protein
MDRYEYGSTPTASTTSADKKELDKIKRYIKAMESEIYQKMNTREESESGSHYLEIMATKLSEIEHRQT